MSIFSALGSAIGAFASSSGDRALKAAYKKAEVYTEEQQNVSDAASELQQTMVARQAFRTLGAQQSQYAGAGMTESGSALDILRSSQQQAALSKQTLQTQQEVNDLGYETQEAMYKANASVAGSAALGSFASGVMDVADSIMQAYATFG